MREFSVRLLGVEVFAVTLGVPEYDDGAESSAAPVSLGVVTEVERIGFVPDPYYDD